MSVVPDRGLPMTKVLHSILPVSAKPTRRSGACPASRSDRLGQRDAEHSAEPVRESEPGAAETSVLEPLVRHGCGVAVRRPPSTNTVHAGFGM